MGISTSDETRSKRFNLRATQRQEELIRVAAERRGVDVTDFIIESACEKAEQTLADQAHFVLDQKQWDLFMKALDEPPRVIPQIRKLFAAPAIASAGHGTLPPFSAGSHPVPASIEGSSSSKGRAT